MSDGRRPFTMDLQATLHAIVIEEADGGDSAIVPALPGCATCGETMEEVRAFLREAAEGYLAVLHDENAPGVTAQLIEDSGAAEAPRATR